MSEIEITHVDDAAPARRLTGQGDDFSDDSRQVGFGLLTERMIRERRLIHAKTSA